MTIDSYWDVLRAVNLLLAAACLGGMGANVSWYLKQPPVVRLLLFALSVFVMTQALAAYELLSMVNAPGGIRVFASTSSLVSTFVALMLVQRDMRALGAEQRELNRVLLGFHAEDHPGKAAPKDVVTLVKTLRARRGRKPDA